MTYQQIIEEVSLELGLPAPMINNTYKAYWRFIRDTILQLPLKNDMCEEEFNKLKTNFNIPSLGKIYCNFDKYRGIKELFQHAKKLIGND